MAAKDIIVVRTDFEEVRARVFSDVINGGGGRNSCWVTNVSVKFLGTGWEVGQVRWRTLVWQIVLPEVALVEVRLLVFINIVLVLFEDVEVDDFVNVAKATHTFARSKDGVDNVHEVVVDLAVTGHSPALIACHAVARGNDGLNKERVEHGNKENAEVPCPRN